MKCRNNGCSSGEKLYITTCGSSSQYFNWVYVNDDEALIKSAGWEDFVIDLSDFGERFGGIPIISHTRSLRAEHAIQAHVRRNGMPNEETLMGRNSRLVKRRIQIIVLLKGIIQRQMKKWNSSLVRRQEAPHVRARSDVGCAPPARQSES